MKAQQVSLLHEDHAYYLAGIDHNGFIVQLDGGHSEPSGVAQAKKLYDRLGFTCEGVKYVMLKSSPIPSEDVPIDEDAARRCRAMLDRYSDAI